MPKIIYKDENLGQVVSAKTMRFDNEDTNLNSTVIEDAIIEVNNKKADDKVEFTEATDRRNIVSGESNATIFSKIRKFFADLKTVAFTGSYNDLVNKPTLGTAASTDASAYATSEQGLKADSAYLSLSGKAEAKHTHSKSDITDFPSALPASDVYSWAKASSKPSYTFDEISGVKNGTITFGKSDDYGIRTNTNNYGRIGDSTNQLYEVYANRIFEDKTLLANKYAAKSHTHSKSEITDFPSSLPASDVYSWAKASSKPSYTYSEVGAASSSHTHSQYLTSHQSLDSCAKVTTDNNLITHSDEFNFVASGQSGAIWFNYRTAGGTNGNITEYKLGNGKGASLGSIIHSGNIGSQSVNYASSAGSVAWSNVSGKPSSYTPSSHKQAYTSSECTSYDADDNTMGCTPASVKKAIGLFEPKSHSHDYLPLSGGTLTGNVNLKKAIFSTSQYIEGNSQDLNLYSGTSSSRGYINARVSEVFQVRNVENTSWKPISANAFNTQSNSSRELKENILPIDDNRANQILKLEVVTYDYKEGVMPEELRFNRTGVIAEDVESICPEVINYDNGEPSGVQYDRFIPYLIKVVQNQQREIESLRKELKELKCQG